jgi:hypothetical protein
VKEENEETKKNNTKTKMAVTFDWHASTTHLENEIFWKLNFCLKSFSAGVVEMCPTAKSKMSSFFREEKEDFMFFPGSACILAHVPKKIISLLYKLREIFTKSSCHQIDDCRLDT